MTMAWNPTRTDHYSPTAMTLVYGPLVDGDLCDMRVGRGTCHQDAVREAVDVDGSIRLLCADCVTRYFPGERGRQAMSAKIARAGSVFALLPTVDDDSWI